MKAIKFISKDSIAKSKLFIDEKAQETFLEMGSWDVVSECGVDSVGNIYFKFTYGITEQYSRIEFIRMTRGI